MVDLATKSMTHSRLAIAMQAMVEHDVKVCACCHVSLLPHQGIEAGGASKPDLRGVAGR